MAGGLLYSYTAGTTVPRVTYADEAGLAPNTNPVVLDSEGYADVYIGAGYYKFVLADADDVVQWTKDNVSGNLSTAIDGVDGKSIRYGAVPPGPGDGNDGDFYIDTAAFYLYGPKTAGVWPAGTTMQGPAGVDGADGTNGVDGNDGADGIGIPAGGAAGQLLSKGSNADYDSQWINPPVTSPNTTKGDVAVHNGTADQRLAVGADGYLLTADSAQGLGVKWAPAPVSLPSQTGNAGKFLKTNGTTASWVSRVELQEVPAGLVNGVNLVYTLSQTPTTAGSVKLTVDGLMYRQGVGLDYTISGNTITMAAALETGQEPYAIYSYEAP